MELDRYGQTRWKMMEKGRFEKNFEIHLNGVKKDGRM